MLFNSLTFFAFLGTVLTLYYFLPTKYKWILLLAASYFFYMCWRWEYIFLIMWATVVDFIMGQCIEKAQTISRKRLFLGLSLFSNLGLLFYFKYFNFFIDSVNSTSSFLGFQFSIPFAEILLPVGISFYTFQSISYILEVYYGRQSAVKHFGKFALFITYFPQLVAGPIERPQNLIHQLDNPQPLVAGNIVQGMRLFLWGLFKKVVIADRLAYFVDIVYNQPEAFHGLSVVVATVFFAFQIYCDFSGYSDMAIGVAKMMGVDLMKNFRTPYFSTSVKEFWSRWHISLSTWFRDYVYIPLGGNKTSTNRWVINLFVTFLVSGIWHGASWTFVIWGFIHGLVSSLEALNSKKKFIRLAVPPVFKTLSTFVIVCFAWLFFRANNVQDAFLLLRNMVNFEYSFLDEIRVLNGANLYNLVVGFPLIALLLILEKTQELAVVKQYFYAHRPVRYACYVTMIVFIACFGVFLAQSNFIYFQF